MRFSDTPVLMQGWTTDRQVLQRAVSRIGANGGTALYDAVAEAVPLSRQGRHSKKAIVVISDGNDTSSATSLKEVRQLIRESEALVYAIGIDGERIGGRRSAARPSATHTHADAAETPARQGRILQPGGGIRWPQLNGAVRRVGGGQRNDDRVNVAALREMTDESGGRTELIHDPRDLDPATTSIASELSQPGTTWVIPLRARRTAAGTRFGWSCARAPTVFARDEGYTGDRASVPARMTRCLFSRSPWG